MTIVKYGFLTTFTILLLQSCKDTPKTISDKQDVEIAYILKGENFSANNAVSPQELYFEYKKLQSQDSIDITVKTTVQSVCKNKGCWMVVNLPDYNEAMVKFKDYGFFVPKDIEGDTIVMHGKAFVKEVSVEEQRHLAEDAGKPEDIIMGITQPKRTYSFLADGVHVQGDGANTEPKS